jgi:hypothetical protein
LLGEVEAHRVLDEVAEEDLGAGIGEGVADIGIEQRSDRFRGRGAEIIDTAVACRHRHRSWTCGCRH